MRLALVLALNFVLAVSVALADPAPIATPVLVNPDAPLLGQYYGAAGMLSDGSFAVLYEEDSGGATKTDLWLQRFDAAQNKVGARVLIAGTADDEQQPTMAMAPDGRFVVAYLTGPNSFTLSLAVRRFDAAGNQTGGVVSPAASTASLDAPPALGIADDGSFAVAWVPTGGTPSLLYRAYDGGGNARVAESAVSGNEITYQARPSIGMAPDGRFVVAWSRHVTFGQTGTIGGRRYAADGTADGAEFDAVTGDLNVTLSSPSAAMTADGSFVIAWVGRDNDAGGIFARRFPASGPGGAAFPVNDYTTYGQTSPDAALDADGDLLVAYEGQVGTQQWTYVRQFTAADAPVGNGVHVGTGASGTSAIPSLAIDRSARAAVAFGSNDGSGSVGVFVSRLNYAADQQPSPSPSPSPSPTAPAPTQSPTALPATPPKFATLVVLPTTKRCASRRKFGIRLRVPKGSTVIQATVVVNGTRVAVRRGDRLRSTVNLTNLPKGRFTVKITLKLADGTLLSGTRRYRTCAVRRKATKRPKV